MKRVLLSLLFIGLILYSNQLSAQCTVTNLAVSVNSISTSGNGCTINFDLSWQQEINNGNKYAYVHLWNSDKYHTPSSGWPTTKPVYGSPTAYPTSSQLANSILNFVIENNNTLTPSLGISYYPSPGVTINSTATILKTSVSASAQRVEIQNISLTFDDCSVPIALQGDIWASQSENQSNVHCASQGLIFSINDPRVIGFKRCDVPRTYDVSIATTSETSFSVYYNLYKDDGDGIFEPMADDILLDTKNDLIISSSSPYQQSNVSYPGSDVAGENSNLWIEVRKTSGSSYATVAFLENGCASLPVTFSNFLAQRNRQAVALKWETLSEQNNRGFNVQRNTRGVWETIAFVFSQADGGNSATPFTYEYKDANSEKGVSQYRIQQVDLDGRASYSAIRSVKGLEQAGARTVVYPNPSQDGKVNVVFEDQGAKAVVVSDMSGRVVRQYRNVLNNVLIEGLESGMYSIQVTDLSSAVSSTEKVIVKKR